MQTNWNRVKDLFADAAELPLSERAAFLDRECAGDAELRTAVERLLIHAGDTVTQELLPEAPRHSLSPGEVLNGRFRIVRFAGAGGMGEVYEAEDLELGGSVALKTVKPALLDDPQFLSRFRREVQIARQVTHPNLCRIFDVAHDQGRVYLTMEFLEGETLSALLRRRGKLSADAALPVARQLLEGLAALHGCGIVHRDLKPGNVILAQSSQGLRAVISDFGLARALARSEDAPSLSATGHLLGTPDYMAPEQLRGEPASAASDLYALGLLLYEMVTGRKAYPGGGGIENAVQRVLEPPTPPRQHAPELPLRWESAILRCLEREPSRRAASAAAVIEEIAGSGPGPGPFSRRTSLLVAAGIFLAVLAAFFVGLRLTGRGDDPASKTAQRVALLPLTVISDEPELRIFALGLMDTITGRLSQYDANGTEPLLVVPASEVRAQGAVTASDARAKFGATTAVEGSLQSQGDRVRLQLTLIDTQKKVQLETVSLEEPRGNALRLQDLAVVRLANALNAQLQARYASEQDEMSPIEPGAYEYYLQARGYLQRSDQKQSIESAVQLLNKALSLDPKFALAHASLGEARLYQFEQTRDAKLMEEAVRSGQRALELNSAVAGPHISMGMIHMGTGLHAEAQRDFEKALELDSRNSAAFVGLANAYQAQKEYAKAEATYRKAISLRPGDWAGYKALGLFHYNRGEFEKAIEAWRRVIDLNPDNASGYLNLGGAYARLENWREAEKLWTRALTIAPNQVGTLTNLGKAYLETGRYPEAIRMYQQAIDGGSGKFYRIWGNLGAAYERSGQPAKALEARRTAVETLEKDLLINPSLAGTHSALAFYRALVGRSDWRVPLERSLALAPDDAGVVQQAAETLSVAGERERALEYLARAFRIGYPRSGALRSEFLKNLVPLLDKQAGAK